MEREMRRLAVAIARPAAEAYDFLSAPENFPKWATGLAGSQRNAYGVLDHSVTLPRGVTVYVPLRVVPKDEGCELVLTLFRRPGMSNESFAADAEWVMRDLEKREPRGRQPTRSWSA